MREFVNEEGVKMIEMPEEELECMLAMKEDEGKAVGILLRQKFEAATNLLTAAAKLLRL